MNKKIVFIISAMLVTVQSGMALAWNLDAKYLNALRYQKDGTIYFTLFESGDSGSEFQCKSSGTNRQWFKISACDSETSQCLEAVNRMASTLLAAKLSGKRVHVQRNQCEVSEVALKP